MNAVKTSQRHRPAPVRPAAAETHHVKPYTHWAADADEGRALARSNILLPGEHHHHAIQPLDQRHGHERHTCRRNSSKSPSNSDVSSDGRQRRPPSLERQDAFRDEKTVKRQQRRCSWDDDETSSPSLRRATTTTRTGFPTRVSRTTSEEDDDAREIAELYRMGLLYDDEHERGEGFSLGQIVLEEPVYPVRVRPARRRGREKSFGSGSGPSLKVDLAFSALAEDEALARWLVSSCASSFPSFSQSMESERPVSWRVAVHDPPRLAVVYELADDAVSALSAGDFLGSGSVSEFSDCVAEEQFGQDWAMLDACNGMETGASTTAAATIAVADDVDEEVDGPWVVLGHDGS
ncbi:hypothetical protein N658DRAFT_518506 [Parathielavia hyrcaniae]|uniref:Uncharacterized protein n=1 Tax=Parathielavia hyrcaniae TaxID=113614 RepID=A0AAN6PV41_9PEZI|nr:hypothetical protein N658DRAFT_518506 [Parathielavia hyrcaniae]